MRNRPSPTVLELAHQSANSPEARVPQVLVIDDDFVIRDVLLQLLSKRYHVDTLSSGIHLSDFLKDHRPDLIILDVMMPWVNGLDICQLLRNQEETQNIPILFLTARATDKDITQGLKLGASGYLAKPFQKDELLKEIESILV